MAQWQRNWFTPSRLGVRIPLRLPSQRGEIPVDTPASEAGAPMSVQVRVLSLAL
jgi:hypothetical protein